ncbi:MAG: hypothetical protein AAF135_02860 [Bacteroidota bacterium]
MNKNHHLSSHVPPLSYEVCLSVALEILEGQSYTRHDYLLFLPTLQATCGAYPEKADLHFLRGVFHLKLGQIEKAEILVYQCLNKSCACVLYLALLGMIKNAHQHSREAIPFLCYARAKYNAHLSILQIINKATTLSFAQMPLDIREQEQEVQALFETALPDLPFSLSEDTLPSLDDEEVI